LRKLLIGLAAAATFASALPALASRTDSGPAVPECRPIPVSGSAVIGGGTCPGVRPGALVQTSIGYCTMNFLFTNPAGERFIGTAGHCILDENVGGETAWPGATGPGATAFDGAGRSYPIGRFVYAVLRDPKDFALIKLSPGIAANPVMCHFGGPIGINTDLTDAATVLHHYGNGIGLASTVPARTEVATSMANADHVYAQGAAILGDSGSGVVDDAGRAVGVLVTVGGHFGGASVRGVDSGFIGITRIGPQIDRASRLLRTRFALVPGAPRS
jgi:hypothetical protein